MEEVPLDSAPEKPVPRPGAAAEPTTAVAEEEGEEAAGEGETKPDSGKRENRRLSTCESVTFYCFDFAVTRLPRFSWRWLPIIYKL